MLTYIQEAIMRMNDVLSNLWDPIDNQKVQLWIKISLNGCKNINFK